jgi:hypothetical protein
MYPQVMSGKFDSTMQQALSCLLLKSSALTDAHHHFAEAVYF